MPPLTTLKSHDATYLWKLTLRLSSLPSTLLTITLLSLAYPNPTPPNSSSPSSTLFLLPSYPFLILSLLWNTTNIIVPRRIHPAANVACDLILWLALALVNWLNVIAAVNSLVTYPEDVVAAGCRDEQGARDGGGCPEAVEEELKWSARRGGEIAGGVAVAYVVLLFHFALFISACRYVHARRRGGTTRIFIKGEVEDSIELHRLPA